MTRDEQRRGRRPDRAAPPRVAEILLSRLLPRRDREELLGDLAENHAYRVRRSGRLRASLRYWRQTLTIPLRVRWRQVTMARFQLTELRYALRSLASTPTFTAVAVLSLALGIGANTAIFSAVQSILYDKLPVDRPQELRFVYRTSPRGLRGSNYNSSATSDPAGGGSLVSNVTYPAYEQLRQAAGSQLPLAGFGFARGMSVLVDDLPAVSASGLMVSGNYFATLGLGTSLGRPLTEADDNPAAPPVAVLSNGFWQRAFGGDPDVVGRTMIVNGTPFRVVGVTPAGFLGLSPGGFFPPTDVTVTLTAQPLAVPGWARPGDSLLASTDINWVRLLTRVPPDTRVEPLGDALSARLREITLQAKLLPAEDADAVAVRFLDASRGLDSLRRGTERPLQILAAVVAAVLLIACANLAGLTLAKGAARQHELAVRRALGASRARLIRQLLLESVVLAVSGGALGVLLALESGPVITQALTAGFGRVDVGFQLDWTLLAIAAGAAVVAAVLAGLLPAVRLTRIVPRGQLGGRTAGTATERSRLGKVLVAVQIAVSIPLIVGAGLFLRTLANLNGIDPGFDPRGLVVFQIDPSLSVDDSDEMVSIYTRTLESLGALPGVESATLIENALLTGWMSNNVAEIDGEQVSIWMNAVGPDFFDTMRMRIVAGRPVSGRENRELPSVGVVNETAARRLFDGRAVGRHLRMGGRDIEVVGVVADSKYTSLRDDTEPTIYEPFQQRDPSMHMHVVLRTDGRAGALEPAIRETVAQIDRNLPVVGLSTQEELIREGTSRERIFSRLLAVFGVFGLLVACIGLHGVTSFSVSRRRGEMGVRLAIGATPKQVLWLVLRQVLGLAAVGIAVGLLATYLLTPVVQAMLYGLGPTDPGVLAATVAIMCAVAMLAGWLPARRAARTDAVAALSSE